MKVDPTSTVGEKWLVHDQKNKLQMEEPLTGLLSCFFSLCYGRSRSKARSWQWEKRKKVCKKLKLFGFRDTSWNKNNENKQKTATATTRKSPGMC